MIFYCYVYVGQLTYLIHKSGRDLTKFYVPMVGGLVGGVLLAYGGLVGGGADACCNQ